MAFKDAKRCKAKSKRTGQPCRNPARLEREVCRHHGGNTPAGFGSPHFKTGKHSKYLKQAAKASMPPPPENKSSTRSVT